MARFLKVDSIDENGRKLQRLLNVDQIETVEPASRVNGTPVNCIVHMQSMRTISVTQLFSWFEAQLKSRANT